MNTTNGNQFRTAYDTIKSPQDRRVLDAIISHGPIRSDKLMKLTGAMSRTGNITRLRGMGMNILSLPLPPQTIDGETKYNMVMYSIGTPMWIAPDEPDIELPESTTSKVFRKAKTVIGWVQLDLFSAGATQ